MRNANITLTINLNMEIPETMADDKIFDGEINGRKLMEISINVEKRHTNVNCYVTNYIAEQIVLEDNEEEHGEIAFIGETLDDFIQEERRAFKEYGTDDMDDEFIYDIPLGVVNGALNECGIKMITTDEWNEANDKAIKELMKYC